MIFVPSTGVNHHRQSIAFGASFLANENFESFLWLFEAFLKVIRGHKLVIITNQDPTMKVAMENVFNGSFHNFCM